MSYDLIRSRPSTSLARATDRAVQLERGNADVHIERALAIGDVTAASLLSLGRTAQIRAAVELAQPEAAPFAEMIMVSSAVAYAQVIADTGRRR